MNYCKTLEDILYHFCPTKLRRMRIHCKGMRYPVSTPYQMYWNGIIYYGLYSVFSVCGKSPPRQMGDFKLQHWVLPQTQGCFTWHGIMRDHWAGWWRLIQVARLAVAMATVPTLCQRDVQPPHPKGILIKPNHTLRCTMSGVRTEVSVNTTRLWNEKPTSRGFDHWSTATPEGRHLFSDITDCIFS